MNGGREIFVKVPVKLPVMNWNTESQNITKSPPTLCFTCLHFGENPQISSTVKRRTRPILVVC